MAEITKKEFLELLGEFSEKNLDPKFKEIDSRFIEFREDIIHQFHVISEDLIDKVKQVAEGVVNLNEKFERRFDDLNKKIYQNHQDVLAAIKFSYAELDRRITTLETEMEDLKRRMDKIERRSVS
jgi:ABC-type phosphate transport system auxiliary subunit